MYFYLRGKIAFHQKGSVIIDVGGVGYEVLVSHPEDYEIGSTMLVYTVFYVRQDEQFLVGFRTFEEKLLFTRLISVKGVGPKTAVAALGSTDPESLIAAIDSSNMAFLTGLSGIGPKAASQIILDLRGRLMESRTRTGDRELDDAVDGLRSFGFTKKEINEAVSKIAERGLSAEEYISRALALLNRSF